MRRQEFFPSFGPPPRPLFVYLVAKNRLQLDGEEVLKRAITAAFEVDTLIRSAGILRADSRVFVPDPAGMKHENAKAALLVGEAKQQAAKAAAATATPPVLAGSADNSSSSNGTVVPAGIFSANSTSDGGSSNSSTTTGNHGENSTTGLNRSRLLEPAEMLVRLLAAGQNSTGGASNASSNASSTTSPNAKPTTTPSTTPPTATTTLVPPLGERPHKPETLSFSDVCYRGPNGLCYKNSIMELWGGVRSLFFADVEGGTWYNETFSDAVFGRGHPKNFAGGASFSASGDAVFPLTQALVDAE